MVYLSPFSSRRGLIRVNSIVRLFNLFWGVSHLLPTILSGWLEGRKPNRPRKMNEKMHDRKSRRPLLAASRPWYACCLLYHLLLLPCNVWSRGARLFLFFQLLSRGVWTPYRMYGGVYMYSAVYLSSQCAVDDDHHIMTVIISVLVGSPDCVFA